MTPGHAIIGAKEPSIEPVAIWCINKEGSVMAKQLETKRCITQVRIQGSRYGQGPGVGPAKTIFSHRTQTLLTRFCHFFITKRPTFCQNKWRALISFSVKKWKLSNPYSCGKSEDTKSHSRFFSIPQYPMILVRMLGIVGWDPQLVTIWLNRPLEWKLEMLGSIVSRLASPRKILGEKKFWVKYFWALRMA